MQLGDVRDKISVSRKNREDRNAIYAAIQQDNLSEIVQKYRQFKASEPLMKEAASLQRKKEARNGLLTWGGILIGVAGIGIGIYLYFNPYHPPEPNVPVRQHWLLPTR
jgi:hypothetical protein